MFAQEFRNRRDILELNTQIFTLEGLYNTDLSPYDAVYIGDPYSIEYPENLNQDFEGLKKAIPILKSAGKRVYLSTFSVPRNKDLPGIEKLLEFVASNGLPLDAVEIHNAGVLPIVRNSLGNIPIHLGCLSNIYTDLTVNLFKEQGVTRVTGNYELSLDDLKYIKEKCSLEVEILVQGRMALGVSEECPALWWSEGEGAEPQSPADACRKNIELHSDKMNLLVFGRATFSGKDVCVIEHAPLLLESGFNIFRIGYNPAGAEFLKEAGAIYKEIFETAEQKKKLPQKMLKSYMKRLKIFSSQGFCNGYYFKKSGSDYLGARDL